MAPNLSGFPASRAAPPKPGEVVRRFVETPLTAAAVGDTDGGERSIEFVASTSEVDRYGDIVEQSGWRLDQFRKNPALLWAHSYSTPPVGTVELVEVRGGRLMARAKLVREGVSKLADELWGLIRENALKAVSVGFNVGSWDDVEVIRDAAGDATGYKYKAPELLEISLTPVGANASALISRGIAPPTSEAPNMEPAIATPAAPAVAPVVTPEPPTNLRRIAGGAARPSESLTPAIVRTFLSSNARVNFATLGSMGEVKSIVNQGGALVPVPGGATAAVVAADIRPTYLLDLIPFEPRGPGKITVSVVSYAANRAAVVPEGGLKPQSDFSVSPEEISHVKVAHFCKCTTEELDDVASLRGVLDQELLIGLLAKVDSEVILARIVADATPFSPATGSSIIDNAAAMLATLAARGEKGAQVIANPNDLAGALMAKNTLGDFLAYPPAILSAISASPTIPSGQLLGLSPRGISAYERQGEVVVMGLSGDDFVRNVRTLLAEWRGNVAITIPSIVLYGPAVGAP